MKAAKELMDALKAEIDHQVETEQANALNKIEMLQQSLLATDEYQSLVGGQQHEIDQFFTEIQYQIQRSSLVPVIRDKLGRYETHEYNQILTKISAWTQEDDQEVVEYVSQRDLEIKFEKAYLATEDDVENYLQVLKKALLKAIKANKRIRF